EDRHHRDVRDRRAHPRLLPLPGRRRCGDEGGRDGGPRRRRPHPRAARDRPRLDRGRGRRAALRRRPHRPRPLRRLRRRRSHTGRRPPAHPAPARGVPRGHPPALRGARAAGRRRPRPSGQRDRQRLRRNVLGPAGRPPARDRARPPQRARGQRPRPAAAPHDRAGQGAGPSHRRTRRCRPARRAPRQRRGRRDRGPGLRGGRPHRRDRLDGPDPRDRRRRRRHPRARRRGDRAGAPDGRRHGPRRTGGVVRVRVAHDRRGGDPAGGEGQVPGRQLGGHRPIPLAHGQARPPAEERLDRGVGGPGHADAPRHAGPAGAGRHRPPEDRPGREPPGLGGGEAGQLLRRPDRGDDERDQAGRQGRLRDDRGAHRCHPAPQRPARGL
ncbi:MAG: Enoyl-[acyl-carrier-protein] reductase [FMN], partial [uncultured Acidimicrobiales bacterium]